uniref:Uncharacterized protein n=1 Tax=Romanomermis culicivorax TaxID=13658 RepID=A0A915KQP7_ROMCU
MNERLFYVHRPCKSASTQFASTLANFHNLEIHPECHFSHLSRSRHRSIQDSMDWGKLMEGILGGTAEVVKASGQKEMMTNMQRMYILKYLMEN